MGRLIRLDVTNKIYISWFLDCNVFLWLKLTKLCLLLSRRKALHVHVLLRNAEAKCLHLTCLKNPASNWQVCYDWLSTVAWKDTDVCITRWKFQLNLQPLYHSFTCPWELGGIKMLDIVIFAFRDLWKWYLILGTSVHTVTHLDFCHSHFVLLVICRCALLWTPWYRKNITSKSHCHRMFTELPKVIMKKYRLKGNLLTGKTISNNSRIYRIRLYTVNKPTYI